MIVWYCKIMGMDRALQPIDNEGQSIEMRISGGVASWKPGKSFDEIFHAADEALYNAKNSGRNKIIKG